MKPNPGPGKLIVFEGLDGAGTTTQSTVIAEWLRRYKGERAHVTREPSRGPAGVQIRSVLSRRLKMDGRTLAVLFVADRLDHLYGPGGVVERLRAGEWIVMDRYFHSSFAYQSLVLNKDEDLRWLWYLHSPCLIPDVTIFLDVPVEVCLERIALSRGFHFELFENADILERVRSNYLDAIQRFRSIGHNIQIIEGVQPVRTVAQIIRDRLNRLFWDSTALPSEQINPLWKRWPVLLNLRNTIERQLGLTLLTINRLALERGTQGYQLVFTDQNNGTYHLSAYLGSRGNITIHATGPVDDTLLKIREIIRRPSLWNQEMRNG